MRRLTTAVLALVLLGSTPALAADYRGDNNRSEQRDNSRDVRDQNSRDVRDQNRHGNNFRHNRWNRGDKISRSWFLYTPVDWRRHHFRAPSYGYHWIYVDGMYLLIDRNGFIVQVAGG